MRLTDKDELIATIKETNCKPCKSKGKDYYGVKCRTCPIENEIEDIDEAQTIDAEPVVRCKDCIHWNKINGCCSVFHSSRDDESYCELELPRMLVTQ